MLDENQSKLSEDLMEFRRDASMLNVSVAVTRALSSCLPCFPSKKGQGSPANSLGWLAWWLHVPTREASWVGLACVRAENLMVSLATLTVTITAVSLTCLFFASSGRAVAYQCQAEYGNLGL